jgi:serine protease inhibitor
VDFAAGAFRGTTDCVNQPSRLDEPHSGPHTDFAVNLHRALAAELEAEREAGLVCSPYSVASALGLAAAGAAGPTYEELAAALAPGGELAAQGRMLTESARPQEAEAAVANTLWLRTGLQVEGDYRQAVLDWPGGSVRAADFRADPEAARRTINADVEETTRGLIKDLLVPGMIHPAVAAVIVNALYLKVAWLLPFPAGATAATPFHAPTGTIDVPTMRQTERMRHAAAAGWRMVTLAAAGGELAVDILLPDDPDDPADPGAALPGRDVLARLHEATTMTKIELSLPRFRIESKAILNSALARLGVVRAFTQNADFSGITREERLRIDQVVHQAVLTVDEEGFEGAAATAVVMRTVSVDLDQPVEFRVDRPFLMIIRHSRTGAVFFCARVTEPIDPRGPGSP